MSGLSGLLRQTTQPDEIAVNLPQSRVRDE